MIKHIAFSAYPVADMAKAREFYEGVLGLEPSDSFGGFWQEYTLGEGTFAIVQYNDETPEFWTRPAAAVAFEVENLTAFLERLQAKSVPIVMEKADFPTCSMACISDPDGNIIALHQMGR